MEYLLKGITKRSSILILSIGAILLIIGASNGVTIGNLSLIPPDTVGRILFVVVGMLLIGVGVSLEIRDQSVQQYRSLYKTSSKSYFQKEPQLITSSNMNRLKIESGFLLWEKCTLVMWVLVPPKGQGFRDSPSNRYLLAHHTGNADEKGIRFHNQFCVRHSSTRKRWEVTFSDNNAEYTSAPLAIADGVTTGWHHFMISWDRNKPRIEFKIDDGKSGNDFANSLSNWPEKAVDNASVGAWMSDWGGHYCETQIYQFLIFDDYLESTDSVIRQHINNKPRPTA